MKVSATQDSDADATVMLLESDADTSAMLYRVMLTILQSFCLLICFMNTYLFSIIGINGEACN